MLLSVRTGLALSLVAAFGGGPALAQAPDPFTAALTRIIDDLTAAGAGNLGEVTPEKRVALVSCMVTAMETLPAADKQAVIDNPNSEAAITTLQDTVEEFDEAMDGAVLACFETAFGP